MTEVRLRRAQNELIRLRANLNASELEPFGPRLIEKQQLVKVIVRVVEALSARTANLTNQFDMILPIVMQALQTQNTQVQVALNHLKGRATTIFVLGSTSNELVDRIIFEFSAANDFLRVIRNELFPSIASLALQIDSSLADGILATDSVLTTLTLVSSQVAELETLIQQISQLIVASNNDYSLITQSLNISSSNISSLVPLRLSSENDVLSLSAVVNDIYVHTQRLLTEIRNFPITPDPPSSDSLTVLITNFEMIANDVSVDVLEEITVQNSQLLHLTQLLEQKQSLINSYVQQIEVLENSTSLISNTASIVQSEVSSLVMSTNRIISQAEMIFQRLQEFLNDSLQLSKEASSALEQVTAVSESARQLSIDAQSLEERIVQVSEQLEPFESICTEAENVISETNKVYIYMYNIRLGIIYIHV